MKASQLVDESLALLAEEARRAFARDERVRHAFAVAEAYNFLRQTRLEYLREGLSLAAENSDQTTVAYYLEELAALASLQRDPRRAVCLLAGARSLLETKGSGWLHAWVPRAPHDDAVLAALRTRIGDSAFDEADQWGRSLRGARAVQYALEQDRQS